MSLMESMAGGLMQNVEMMKMTIADFSDADMLTRPCPGANHAAWQIGHLIGAETHFFNTIAPGKAPELPAGFAERFSKENSKNDDAKAFPKKEELLSRLSAVRGAFASWVKTITPADLDKSGPHPQFAPTVGALISMTPVHAAMHIGQFQVIRRKLGKPVLF